MYEQSFIEDMKSRLMTEKERIDKKLKELTAPEIREANPDWDDTANDAIEDVEQDSLLRIYRGLSERVETAIKKIEDGTYGQCHECGKEVPKEKLELEAWAEHCSADCIKVHNQNE
jgi:DnaK suppressor protein